MSKKEKNLITVNDIEYNVDDFTDEQKIMLNHINDLGRKIDNSRFNLDQLAVGRDAFVMRLSASLEIDASTEDVAAKWYYFITKIFFKDYGFNKCYK